MAWVRALGAAVVVIGGLVAVPSGPALAAPGDITTVAGGGIGDGGVATNASLRDPHDVAIDSSGNLYIAERERNLIRKVGSAGTITTVAGTGVYGYSGDGGPATGAQLRSPRGVAIDSSGNVYVADTSNHRIRKVDSSGTITTIAGTGASGYYGDGGLATSAKLSSPTDLSVDAASNVYIADSQNHRIRKVDSSGTITTIAGTGTPGYFGDGLPATSADLNYPNDVALGSSGSLYIADQGNQRVRRVDSSGVITTVAGKGEYGHGGDGGPAVAAQLQGPQRVVLTSGGDLLISAGKVRRVDSTGIITTAAGHGNYFDLGDGGPATSATVQAAGLAADSGDNFYVADTWNDRIRKVNAAGTISTVAGGGAVDGGPATSADLYGPGGVVADSSGNLYVADGGNNRVRKVDTSGTITTIAGTGVYGSSGDGGPATSAKLAGPGDVALDSAGNLYIADTNGSRIRRVDSSGTITTVAGSFQLGYSGDGGPATSAKLHYPRALALDSSGNLYIADTSNHRIRKVDTSGTITTVAGTGTPGYSGDSGPALSAALNYPNGVAVDSSGILYIADKSNHRIRKVDTSGTITTVAGTGVWGYSGDGDAATSAQVAFPNGVALDSSGNLYIADTSNHGIRKVDTAGTITTVAGTGAAGFSGDGGAATSAQLDRPGGATVGGAGDLYIADRGNHRIRRVEAVTSATTTTTAPPTTTTTIPPTTTTVPPTTTTTIPPTTTTVPPTTTTVPPTSSSSSSTTTTGPSAPTGTSGGAGTITGTVSFGSPGVPAILQACVPTNFALQGVMDAVTVNTMVTAFVGPVQLSGTGSSACEDALSGEGSLNLAAHGQASNGATLHCGSLVGSYRRVFTLAFIAVTGRCAVNELPTAELTVAALVGLHGDEAGAGASAPMRRALLEGPFAVVQA